MARLTIEDIKAMKRRGEKIPMLTAYDYPSARMIDEMGVPLILVGDSLGMVVLGYETTIPVTIEEMIHHAKAVMRGVQRALVVVDMPFLSFQTGWQDALRNAGRILKETGAQAVKLEGGAAAVETVHRLVEAGIPVMGHIGLTPQSVNQLGGYKVQGRTPAAAVKLLNDALALQEAGIFSLVLETIPAPLGKLISERLEIPTIGIGAGPYCDGQVQVFHDFLGMYPDFTPKHTKHYVKLGEIIREAIARYAAEVRQGEFPTEKQSFKMDEAALEELRQMLYGGISSR